MKNHSNNVFALKCKACGKRSNFRFKNSYSIRANGLVTRYVLVKCPKCFAEGVYVWHPKKSVRA
jgi:ribosomal protein S27E